MAGSIKGIIVEIGGDTSGLQKALSKVNSATSSLSRELRGVNSLLKLDPKNTELLKQKQDILNESIVNTQNKLRQLQEIKEQADDKMANGTEINSENYRALQREIITTENKLKNLQVESSKLTQVGRKFEEIGTKIQNVESKIDSLGNKLTTRITTPILALGTVAITTGNEFEAQMSRVQAIAGATKDELELLTEQAIELGSETSFSATEVATAMENLASAGFTTTEIMESIPGLLNLAASSGAELGTASEIAASAIRGFGLEADSSAHVADVFAEAAAKTNAQTEDMGEAMKYVAPVAKTVGLTIEETAAAIGIMSDAGIKGSQAGTTLRSGLTRIIKPTKQVKEAMETLGVEFYDNNGKMKSLTEIIEELQKGTKGLTDETKNQALAQIFGTEALSGMLALVNEGPDELKDLTKSFKKCDGAAEEMAETMLDNTSGAIESLKGSLESAEITIQKALSPTIKKLSKNIQKLVDSFNDLSEEEQQNIIKIGLMIASAGPLIKVLGTVTKTIGTASKGIGIFSQAVAVAENGTTSSVTSVNNLAKAFSALTSPTGLLITSFVGLAIAAASYETHQQEMLGNSSKVKKAIDEEVKSRDELIQKQREKLDSDLAEIEKTQELYNELKGITDENGKIKDGYEKRANYIVNQLSEALGIEIDINNGVIESYQKIQDEIDKTILKKKAESIVSAGEEKYNEALEKRAGAYETLEELEEKYQGALIKSNGTYDTNAKLAAESIKQQLKKQKELIEGYNTDIANYERNQSLFYENTKESLTELVRANEVGITKINDDTYNGITSQIEYYNNLVEDYKELKEEQLEKGNNYRAKEYEEQEKSNQKQLEQLTEQLAEITTTTNINEPEIQEAWKSISTNASSVFFNTIGEMPEDLQIELLKIAGVVNENAEVENSMKELAKDAEKGFNNNVDGAKWGTDLTKEVSSSMTNESSKSRITSASSKVASWISQYLHFSVPDKGPLADMDKSMPDMIDLMVKGIDNSKLKLIKSAERLAKNLNNSLNLQSNIPLNNFDNAKINSQVIDSTKTIFTTPTLNIYAQDELTPAKMNSIIDTVNKRLGSQY